MSNLSDLLPAGGGQNAEKFTATGTLPSGQAVALKADGTVEAINVTGGVGTESVFEAAAINFAATTYDSNSNKVVIGYRDDGNSYYGTAVVGTVSGTSITFGTPVVFETSNTTYLSATFDSTNNKVVFSYTDSGNSDYGTAIVGTVSGTSISFGAAAIFESAISLFVSATFDSNSNKVVIAYSNSSSPSGRAVVGTVSGTSISFGTPVTFQSSNTVSHTGMCFDSSLNKIFLAFTDGNASYGMGVVGTVSGTSISFGSIQVYQSNSTKHHSPVFDSNSNKVAIVYNDDANETLRVKLATISGTSVTYGNHVAFNPSNGVQDVAATFDSNLNKIIVPFRHVANSHKGSVFAVTITGNNLAFDTADPVVFSENRNSYITAVFDTNSNTTVIAYRDTIDTLGGALTYAPLSSNTTDFLGITAEGISNGATGSVNMLGGINEAQSGLTIGSDYYVQDDGSLNTATSVANYDIANASYTQAFSVASQDTQPSAIAFNPAGTKMFIAGNQGNDIGEYTLSTAFDVSTASFVDSFSVNSQETAPMGVAFNTDGTRMFVNGEATNTVFQYALSTGFDVSTASYTQGFSTAAQDSASNGIAFNTDGTKMFVTAESTKKINEYTLSSAFDVSTASFVDGFLVSSQADQPKDTQFNSDGTEMYLVSRSPATAVYKYTLTTGFDVSTASYANVSFSIAEEETSPQGLAFSADGSKMYVCGFTGQDVNDYATSTTVANSTTVKAGQAISATTINMRNLT